MVCPPPVCSEYGEGGCGRTTPRRGAVGAGGWERMKWRGGGARNGPGREGPEAWPPRRKVGAEERSPSAPRLGPSIVNERGDEAPRVEPGEPHSPDLLPFGGGFVSCEDLFAPRSPVCKPSTGETKCRGRHLGRRDGKAVSRAAACAPSDRLLAAHSLERARLDGPPAPSRKDGTRRS